MPAGGQRARKAGRCQTASTIRRDHHARSHVLGRNLALPHGRHLQEAGSPADNSRRPPTGAPCGALALSCPGAHGDVGGGVSFGSFAPLQSSWPHPLGQHGHDPAPPAYPHADHAAEVGRGVRQGFHPVHLAAPAAWRGLRPGGHSFLRHRRRRRRRMHKVMCATQPRFRRTVP